MLSKAKLLYQVKLILDYLPKEEYNLIPQETIHYIEDNFEYDENIIINPNISLEKQKIDDKAYKLLNEIIKSTEKNNNLTKSNNFEIDTYVAKIRNSNEAYNVKIENIKLNHLIENLKKETTKIPEAKKLFEEYKLLIKQKDKEIKKLKEENLNLYCDLTKIPWIIRKIFIKNK